MMVIFSVDASCHVRMFQGEVLLPSYMIFCFLAPQVADGLPGIHKAEILGLCDEVDILSRQLSDLCRRGHGDTPQAQEVARYIR